SKARMNQTTRICPANAARLREGNVYQPQTAPPTIASAARTAPMPEIPAIPLPPEPQSIEQTGLTMGFLADLALKTLYLRGQLSMAEVASALGLPITGVIDHVMEFLKNE